MTNYEKGLEEVTRDIFEDLRISLKRHDLKVTFMDGCIVLDSEVIAGYRRTKLVEYFNKEVS